MAYEIVAGDTGPPLPVTLTVNGAPAVLNSDEHDPPEPIAMYARWRLPDGRIDALALTPVDLATGQLEHVWDSGETDVPGLHRMQVVVEWVDDVRTFPSDGKYFSWRVWPRLA